MSKYFECTIQILLILLLFCILVIAITEIHADNFVCDDNSKSCDSGNKRTSFVCGDHHHPCNEQNKNNESEEQ